MPENFCVFFRNSSRTHLSSESTQLTDVQAHPLSQKSVLWLCLLPPQLHGGIHVFLISHSEYVTSFPRPQEGRSGRISSVSRSGRTHTSCNLFWKWMKFPFKQASSPFPRIPISPVYPVLCRLYNALISSLSCIIRKV